ncbi:hypothetical protein PoB_002076700 [Plakobranchus ocellatus]|uniref:Uncharacterized protein n=1 Tax=Plakobranchus ocellatus TaxID=259542 RepID=A0AAV3ZG23_9GAST|nr:hypothetical protein PoB_002076700 [Plakobranchus ocellatus]
MAGRNLVSRLLYGWPESDLLPTVWLAGVPSPAYCMAGGSLVSCLLYGGRSLISCLLYGLQEYDLLPTVWLAGV